MFQNVGFVGLMMILIVVLILFGPSKRRSLAGRWAAHCLNSKLPPETWLGKIRKRKRARRGKGRERSSN